MTILSPNHALRIGLREILSAQPDVQVVGDAREAEDIDLHGTEVLVLTSVSSMRVADFPTDSLGILLVTDDTDDVRRLADSNARAWGVISAGATGEELAAALHAVGEGLWVGAPGLVQGLMRSMRRGEASAEEIPADPLSAREKEVLQLMAGGLANKQIALQLGISEHTVKFHLSSLYAKLNVSSRTEAVKRGLGLGLIFL